MSLIYTLLLWTWVLGISLLIPTSLPAGGVQKAIIEQGNNYFKSPIIALKEFNLLTEIGETASTIIKVDAGTPVKVLKIWESPDQGKWLLIDVISQSYYQFFSKRGWVRIGIF